jgi:hypothetical protein
MSSQPSTHDLRLRNPFMALALATAFAAGLLVYLSRNSFLDDAFTPRETNNFVFAVLRT